MPKNSSSDQARRVYPRSRGRKLRRLSPAALRNSRAPVITARSSNIAAWPVTASGALTTMILHGRGAWRIVNSVASACSDTSRAIISRLSICAESIFVRSADAHTAALRRCSAHRARWPGRVPGTGACAWRRHRLGCRSRPDYRSAGTERRWLRYRRRRARVAPKHMAKEHRAGIGVAIG